MPPNRPQRQAWAVAGAFLTLLALGSILPSKVEAGCAHPSDRPSLALDFGARNEASPNPLPALLPGPRSCTGPQCSGKSAPPASAAPQAPPRSALWALPPEPLPGPEAGPTGRVAEDPPAHPRRSAVPVFHPPRIPRRSHS